MSDLIRGEYDGLTYYARRGTSDANSFIACAVHDEYGLKKYTLDGARVFDIGGHVGGVSILAARLGALVVCVEPVPENCEIIEANAAVNGLDIHVIRGAVGTDTISYGWTGEGLWGEETGRVHAWVGNTGHGLEREGYEPTTTLSVRRVTLAELIREFGKPYLVKLDCEGGEWSFLGEPEALDIPIIVGEYHGWEGNSVGAEEYTGNNIKRIESILGATHDLVFPDAAVGTDDDQAAGHFIAVRR